MDNKTENTVVIHSKKLSKPNSPRYIIADIVKKVKRKPRKENRNFFVDGT